MINRKQIGIIGGGRWGTKIHQTLLESELSKVSDITFIVNSTQDYREKIKENKSDWIINSTPNSCHYRISKYCLENKLNVFNEKPITLNYNQAKELIDIARKKNLSFYIDDIFLFSENLNLIKRELNSSKNIYEFKWQKTIREINHFKSNGKNYLYRLAYHHLYLLIYSLNLDNSEIKYITLIENTKYKLIFELVLRGKKMIFHYNELSQRINSNKLNSINLKSEKQDELYKMLKKAIFSNDSSFIHTNQQLAIKTLNLIELICYSIFPKIVVIGGGIFGAYISKELVQKDYNVTLIEKNEDLMLEASIKNQSRLHKGYHYPRSTETAEAVKLASVLFSKKYPQVIKTKGVQTIYCLSSTDSKTTPNEYKEFMKSVGLEFRELNISEISNLVNDSKINTAFQVKEYLIDLEKMRRILREEVYDWNVKVELNSFARKENLDHYDFKVITTYYNQNLFTDNNIEYEFQLCEKLIVKLDEKFRGLNIVIMDGDFMCLSPYGDSDFHMIGHVKEQIHNSNVGFFQKGNNEYSSLLNGGILKSNQSKKEIIIQELNKYFKILKPVEYIGSYYVVKTILANRKYDDARPTIIKFEKSFISIFSGKISTCVSTVEEILNYIQNKN